MSDSLPMEVLDSIQPFQADVPEKIIKDGGTLQQVKTDYTTAVAVQKPRSFSRFVKNVLEEAALAGADFYYSWNQAGQLIEGGSIDMSMSMLRHYGNAAVDTVFEETATHYRFKAVFIDLETGTTLTRPYRQRKSQKVSKKMDEGRQEDIIFQIGTSKAQRNVIFNALPKWVRSRAIETAKSAEIRNINAENPAIARATVLSFFEQYGISQERVEAKIGKPSDEWSANEIADFKGNVTALKEGRVSPDELFPPIQKEEVTEKINGLKANKQTEPEPQDNIPSTTQTPSEPATVWNPLEEGIKKRYSKKHQQILRAYCVEHEVEYPDGPRVDWGEVHQALLNATAAAEEPPPEPSQTKGYMDAVKSKNEFQVADYMKDPETGELYPQWENLKKTYEFLGEDVYKQALANKRLEACITTENAIIVNAEMNAISDTREQF